jgi:hypothetical protein
METKYIFLDVDGTLVNYNNELPASAVEAIKEAQNNGHKILPLTGRSKAEMYDYILDIGFDGYIGGNGAYIEYEDEVLLHKTLTLAEETEIVDWLQDRGLEFYLESNSGLYGSENFKERGKQPVKDYVMSKGEEDVKDLTVDDVFPDMIYGEDLYRDDIAKISFILDTYDDYRAAAEKFSNLKVGTWGGAGSKAIFGDVGIQDITKATAVELFLERTEASRKDTFAFGDAKIDHSMMEYCEVGVAMGSGSEETKAIADYVTETVDNDGLKNAFKHFDLIG